MDTKGSKSSIPPLKSGVVGVRSRFDADGLHYPPLARVFPLAISPGWRKEIEGRERIPWIEWAVKPAIIEGSNGETCQSVLGGSPWSPGYRSSATSSAQECLSRTPWGNSFLATPGFEMKSRQNAWRVIEAVRVEF